MDASNNNSVKSIPSHPFSFTRKFHYNLLFPLKNLKNQTVPALPYYFDDVPGLKLQFIITPNFFSPGLEEATAGPEDGKVELCLEVEYQSNIYQSSRIKYEISVDSVQFKKSQRSLFPSPSPPYSSVILCNTQNFFKSTKKYFVDGILTIKVEGSLRAIRRQFCFEGFGIPGFLPIGKCLWKNEKYADFSVCVGSNVVKVHKCILAAKSPVFSVMFRSGMIEEKENKVTIIDFDYEIVEIALKFCYDIFDSINLEISQLTELLKFANKYDMSILKQTAEKFILNEICIANVCDLANISWMTNSIEIQHACLDLINSCKSVNTHIPNIRVIDPEFFSTVYQRIFSSPLPSGVPFEKKSDAAAAAPKE